jgi:hypothetical protein
MKRFFGSSPSIWHTIVRVLVLGWMLVSVISLLIDLPARYESLRSLEPVKVSGYAFYGWDKGQIETVVAQLGLRPEILALVRFTASLICLACFWGVAGLLFWRRSDTWVGLLAAFILFAVGPGFSGLQLSQSRLLPWENSLYQLGASLIFPTFFMFLYLFPNGKFIPRFTRYLAVLPYLAFVTSLIVPPSLQPIPPGIFIAYAVGGLVSQMYRYRKVSIPEERQQTKWVVFALGIVLGMILLTPLMLLAFPGMVPGTPAAFWNELIGNGVLGILVPALIPLSLAVSILRFHLWDIDVIIRKTLVYGALTVTLGLVFFGGVVLLQQLISRITGTQNSPVAIVISTLLIAALSTPLRRRIQNDIDRRFYRRKYDAQKTLESFAASVRDEVELEDLTQRLLEVVEETLQPEQVSLWLKPQGWKR